MQTPEIHTKVLALLTRIAPDVEPESVDPDQNLRDQFDFDSMDALHFASAISEAFGIEVAQTDYPSLASLRGAAEFVASKLAQGRAGNSSNTRPSSS
jgi:acyl carrier protein